MKDRTLDYLNQLKPFMTNPRGQSQQLYKNYRNEGMSNYPHMQDYQKTIAQLQAEKENEQNIMNQYQQKKLNLDQSEAEKYKALQGQNEGFKIEYQSLQNQANLEAQKKAAAQQLQNIKQSGASMASIWPQGKKVQSVTHPVSTQSQKNAQRAREEAELIEKNRRINAQSQQYPQQYPPGTQFASSNWRSFPLGSYHNNVDPNNGRIINQPYINSRYYDYGYQ
jgi:hypothetical protein